MTCCSHPRRLPLQVSHLNSSAFPVSRRHPQQQQNRRNDNLIEVEKLEHWARSGLNVESRRVMGALAPIKVRMHGEGQVLMILLFVALRIRNSCPNPILISTVVVFFSDILQTCACIPLAQPLPLSVGGIRSHCLIHKVFDAGTAFNVTSVYPREIPWLYKKSNYCLPSLTNVFQIPGVHAPGSCKAMHHQRPKQHR